VLYVWPISQKPYQKDASWSYFTDIRRIDCDTPADINITYDSICEGESYEWKGHIYTKTTFVADTAMNKYGCDTVVVGLDLTVIRGNLVVDTTRETIYEGDSVEWRGNYYSKQGIYLDTVYSEVNCDSLLYRLELTVQSRPSGWINRRDDQPQGDGARKILYHDQLYIERNGVLYNVLGI